MTDEATETFLHRWRRRNYLTDRARKRRAASRQRGARRIDVTLEGEAFDDYAVVRDHLEGINRIMAERSIKADPFRLSDPEVIKAALRLAVSKIFEDDH
jgi:hypothetical protein